MNQEEMDQMTNRKLLYTLVDRAKTDSEEGNTEYSKEVDMLFETVLHRMTK